MRVVVRKGFYCIKEIDVHIFVCFIDEDGRKSPVVHCSHFVVENCVLYRALLFCVARW